MSSMFFNDVEAAKIAVNMERNALVFYSEAAKRTRDPAVKKIWEQLAADELDHIKVFEDLQQKLLDKPRSTSYLDNEEVDQYMRRLVETHVFAADGAVKRLLDDADTDIAALGVGLQAERGVILFYQEMVNFTDSAVARETFQKIIDEERRHLVALADRSKHCEKLQG